jgi:hypothetical protein
MQKANNLPATSERILRWFSDGKSRPEIEELLRNEGHEEYFIRDILTETIKLRNAKARSQGLVLILTGGLLCLASFFITLVLSYSGTGSDLILYGLTSAGIIFVFAGFMKIF